MSVAKILFTKSFSGEELRNIKQEFQIQPVVQPFIEIDYYNYSPETAREIINSNADCVVFTSQHAVSHFLNYYVSFMKMNRKMFAVGPKTAKGLIAQGFKVIIPERTNGIALAELILRDTSIQSVQFFCGKGRRDEMPDMLKENGVEVHEVNIYETKAKKDPVHIKGIDGVAFFSPSSIESFDLDQPIADLELPCFAIGNTTGNTLTAKGAHNVITADQQNMGSMLETISKYFENEYSDSTN